MYKIKSKQNIIRSLGTAMKKRTISDMEGQGEDENCF